ncbi:hypothetical protein FSP39_019258 [Pinctada imbricata]|uniref:Fork-head domain-containing protein n=1 Tax=Pinctada imbricata TaxID=66713 RepID=A0AA89C716_PINIB|nr:hypothetical protein FSP39_019258 [Pinctada imbricata]
MQHTAYDTSGYQTGLYGSSPTYDGSTIKLHHGHFPDVTESCYNSLFSATTSPGNFLPRDPPSYAESTIFHPGFVPNSSTSYYKVSNVRQPEIPDYGINRTNDQMISKVDILETSPSHIELGQRYESDGNRLIHESELNASHEEGQHIKIENGPDDIQRISNSLTSNEQSLQQVENKPEVEKDDKSVEHVDQTNPEKGHDEKARGNADVKPALSYIALIAKSILESQQKRLSLGSIYSWIEKNYPYYQNRGQGWRNSVRHNLSLNDCFIKAGRCEDGKGNYWAIHPANIQDFMRGDFRQRRRSRRRGRKKECDLGMYHMTNGYNPLAPGVPFSPSAATFSSIYSPYTEAERRAYRLDEALLRQSMNNPFMKWYHNGVPNSSYPPQSPGCNSGMYNNASGQWQTYSEQPAQTVYHPSLSR